METSLICRVDVDQQLLDLELSAAQTGVELMVRHRSDYIALNWIKRHCPNRGCGAQVMADLCRLADRLELPIRLTVLNCPKLQEFYRVFGFVGTAADENGDVEMERQPSYK